MTLTTRDLRKLEEAYHWADNKVKCNPDRGAMWDLYDHYIACIGWDMDEELRNEVDSFYQNYKEKQ